MWRPLLLCLLFPSVGAAVVPCAPNWPCPCQMPSRIVLVGTNGTQPDSRLGAFEVRVCRFSGDPLSGASIVVGADFQPIIRLGREAEPAPQPLLSCASPYVRTVSNANGQAYFTIAGSIDMTQVGGSASTVTIYANGTSLGDVPVVCYDLDGHGGVGAGDLSQWLTIFGSGEQLLFADYNGDGAIGADDLSMWFDVFGSGNQVESATPLCP